MSLQVEKMEKNMAKLTIEVSAEEFRQGNAECIPESKRQNLYSGIP